MSRAVLLLTVVLLLAPGCSRKSGRGPGPVGRGPDLRPITAEGIRAEIANPGPRAVLVNVWATWCAPCREEFPELVRLHRAYQQRGLKLILVSADFDDQTDEARRFLADQGVHFTTFLKTGDDQRFIEGLDPRWTGALPATWLYDGRGTLRYFHEGRTTFATLEPQVLAALSDTLSR